MIEPRKGDSEIVAHARRELEMADAFTKTDDYDGKIGRAVLDLVKSFDSWTKDDPAAMQVVANTFSLLIHGEILAEPTTDPDEWLAIEKNDKTVWRNKRSPFYFSDDNGIHWYNVTSKENGPSKNHITGEVPTDGSKSIQAPADTAGAEAGSDQGSDSSEESNQGRRVNPGVAAESSEDTPESEAGTAKPPAGEAS